MSLESRLQKLESIIAVNDDEAGIQEECRLLRVGINGNCQRYTEEELGLSPTIPAPSIELTEELCHHWTFSDLRSWQADYGRQLEAAGFRLDSMYRLVRTG
jgi:hypothetical protein